MCKITHIRYFKKSHILMHSNKEKRRLFLGLLNFLLQLDSRPYQNVFKEIDKTIANRYDHEDIRFYIHASLSNRIEFKVKTKGGNYFLKKSSKCTLGIREDLLRRKAERFFLNYANNSDLFLNHFKAFINEI